jgi:BlaI family penicillinase repressor
MNGITLSDGEWKLMNLLWDESPLTMARMVEAMKNETGWSKSTINVMLIRLSEKGAVRIESDGFRKFYYPMIDRESAVKQEAKSTLKKVRMDGIGLLVSTMTEESELSSEEIDELIAILKGAKKQ